MRFVGRLLRLGLSEEAGMEARRLMLENGAEAVAPETTYRVGDGAGNGRKAEPGGSLPQSAAAATADPKRADRSSWPPASSCYGPRVPSRGAPVTRRIEAFGVDEPTRAFATRLRCVAEVMAHDGAAARACIAAMPVGTVPRGGGIDELVRALEVDVHARAIAGGICRRCSPGSDRRPAGDPGDGLLALAVNAGFATGVYFLLADGSFAGRPSARSGGHPLTTWATSTMAPRPGGRPPSASATRLRES